MQRRHLYAVMTLGLSLVVVATWADSPPPFTIPFSFTAHTAAKASEVNANFTALENQIQYLNQQLIAQQTINNDQQSRINALQTALSAIQGSNVMALDPYVALVDVEDGHDRFITYPTVQFSGVNVQILNGTGDTFSTMNGLGNLIIGYNEYRGDGVLEFCSDGHYTNQTDCNSHGGTWGTNQRTGSHNLVLGISNSYTSFGGFLAGQYNVVNGPSASVAGGLRNMARTKFASVSGGTYNTASGEDSSVSGGNNNTASGDHASVTGGEFNTAGGLSSSVAGGSSNVAYAQDSSISGGGHNYTSGPGSVVSGGYLNEARASDATVSGGEHNQAEGKYSTISGGAYNSAANQSSTVGGGLGHSATTQDGWRAGDLPESQ